MPDNSVMGKPHSLLDFPDHSLFAGQLIRVAMIVQGLPNLVILNNVRSPG